MSVLDYSAKQIAEFLKGWTILIWLKIENLAWVVQWGNNLFLFFIDFFSNRTSLKYFGGWFGCFFLQIQAWFLYTLWDNRSKSCLSFPIFVFFKGLTRIWTCNLLTLLWGPKDPFCGGGEEGAFYNKTIHWRTSTKSKQNSCVQEDP